MSFAAAPAVDAIELGQMGERKPSIIINLKTNERRDFRPPENPSNKATNRTSVHHDQDLNNYRLSKSWKDLGSLWLCQNLLIASVGTVFDARLQISRNLNA